MYNIEILSRVPIGTGSEVEKYTYKAAKIEDLPDLAIMNSKLVAIEKYDINNRTNYDLVLFSYDKAHEYSLREVFPIILNGEELKPETHYIYVDYDVEKKSYVLLVSENKDYCVKDSKENKVAYYEFRIDIDYNDYTFKTPTFVRTWYERDGCSHYNKSHTCPPNSPKYTDYTKDYEKGLSLYSSGVLIMDKCKDLLPDYLSFVKGVVDTEDISLNISSLVLRKNQLIILGARLGKSLNKRFIILASSPTIIRDLPRLRRRMIFLTVLSRSAQIL